MQDKNALSRAFLYGLATDPASGLIFLVAYALSMFATALWSMAYRGFAKPYFFRRDPEAVHDRMTNIGSFLGSHIVTRKAAEACFHYRHPALEQNILGIRFANPIGLAAGFDKDARLTDIMAAIGFGFEEIGSVTGEPCEGNPKPRLWRLPKSRGILVHYGLKNEGCEVIAHRLRNRRLRFPVGTSIAKTNSPATVDIPSGIRDYAKAFRAFSAIGDYFTVNISCPNAYGGELFSDPARLDALLAELDAIPTQKPVFLKLPADIGENGLREIVSVSRRHRLHGFIASNLTKRRDLPGLYRDEIAGHDKGGISGVVLRDISNNLVSRLYVLAGGEFVIVGCGGVFSAEDAYEKIRRGASLVQLVTGLIYNGPQHIGEINRGLARLLQRDGFASVREAVGIDVRNASIARSA